MLHPRITEFVTITVSRGFIIYLSRIVLFCAHFLAILARLSSRTISVAEFLFRDLVAVLSTLRTTVVSEFSTPGTTLVAVFSIFFSRHVVEERSDQVRFLYRHLVFSLPAFMLSQFLSILFAKALFVDSDSLPCVSGLSS